MVNFVTARKQWVLVGVTSYGYDCAQHSYDGIYTRITAYTMWINSTISGRHQSSVFFP